MRVQLGQTARCSRTSISRITSIFGEAIAALLAREPHAVLALHEEQVVHQDFFLLQQFAHELAILTPSESKWIEIPGCGAPIGDSKGAHYTSKGNKQSPLPLLSFIDWQKPMLTLGSLVCFGITLLPPLQFV